MRRNLALSALITAAAALSSPAHAYLAVTLTSPGIEYSGSEYTLGFEFSVAEDTTIVALGAYDSGQDGLNGTAEVGLWDTSGNLLASATVPTGTAGTLVNDFRFASIAPYALTAGVQYIIGAFEPDDLASSLNTGQGGSGFVDPNVTIYQDQYSNFNSAFSFPDTSDFNPGGAWLGANFITASAVPETSTWAMLALGFAGLGFAGYRSAKSNISIGA